LELGELILSSFKEESIKVILGRDGGSFKEISSQILRIIKDGDVTFPFKILRH
jgi:hypothetical protein